MDLNYTIGADASNFNQNVQGLAATARTASNEVSQSLAQASQSVDNLGGAALSSSMRMMQMRSGISAARDGVLAFTVGGQAAERSLLAMGHHINSLVNETGSFRGAMGALASSLWGPGGIILGLSLAVELFLKWERTSKKAAEAQSEFDKSLEGSIKTSSDELSHLTILYQATQNDALSRQQRLLAVRELQKEYPAYFGNLSKEAILAGDAAGAYDRLSDSIINSAIVKAGQEGLSEEIKPLIKAQAELQAMQNEAEKNYQRQKAAFKPDSTTQGFRPVDVNSLQGFRPVKPNNVLVHNVLVADNPGVLDKYKQDIEDKIKANAGAIQSLLERYGIGTLLKHNGLKDDKIKTAKEGLALLQQELKNAETALENSVFAGKTSPEDVDSPLARRVSAATEAIRKFKSDIDAVLGGIGANNTTTEDSIKSVKPQTGDLANGNTPGVIQGMQAQVKAFAALNIARTNSIASTKKFNAETKEENKELAQLKNVIGTGLNQAFQSALSGSQNFFSAMGNFLIKLIEQLIAAVAEALLLATILSVLSGGTLSVVGALSGSAIQGFGSGASMGAGLINGFTTHASGGIFTQAHAGIFGEAGPEAIVTPQHLMDFAGVSSKGNNDSIKIEPFQIGASMWFKQGVRTDKRIGRIS